MAYILLRNISVGEKQPIRRLYACSCQNLYKNNRSSTDSSQRCFHSSSRPRHRFAHSTSQLISQEHLWKYSSVYYKSKFLQTYPLFSHISLYEDLVLKRAFHSTAFFLKEETMVEKSVKALKDKVDKDKQKQSETVFKPVSTETQVVETIKQSFIQKKVANFKATLAVARKTGFLRYFWEHFVSFIRHYRDGFKLFWIDIKICIPLLWRYITKGRSTLKRREYKMLTKTLADLVRMVPLIPMLMIPFAELLIPLYINLGMMPTVFNKDSDKDERSRQILQKKLEYGALLTESLNSVPVHSDTKSDGHKTNFSDFTEFMEKVKDTAQMPSNEDIMKFSRLFEDELTLDDLTVEQLQSLCKLLNIGFLGEIPSRRILRFQIGLKLRELEVDDKMIQKEGVESLTIWELQAANRSRGMRAIGLSGDRLKLQIQQWLELHLKEKIPSTLLLLSRVMYLDERLSPAEQLINTIARLPETTVTKVKVVSSESMGEDVDKTTKIKFLSEEQKAIKEEKKLEEAELAAQKEKMETVKKAAELDEAAKRDAEAEKAVTEPEVVLATKTEPEVTPVDVAATPVVEKVIAETAQPLPDIAEPVVAAVSEEFKAEPVKDEHEEEHVTSKDLEDIEKAIDDMAKHHKDDIADVKEDLEEYKEDVEDIKALCVDTSFAERVQESKGAQVLRAKLDKYLSKLDNSISALQEEKMKIQETLEFQEIKLKYEKDNTKEIIASISDKKENLISVNDVLMSVKRLQKVPDDVRMQKVLMILDTDKDGLIDINDVLKVTEELGRENLNLNKAQVSAVIELLRKEGEIELEEKQIEKEEKVMVKKDEGNSVKPPEVKVPDS